MDRTDIDAARAAFLADGVVCIRGALDPAALDVARAAFDWSLANPSSRASQFEGGTGRFYQDLANPHAADTYRVVLDRTPAAELAAGLLGTEDLWFMYEQVFLKEGGESRRTPWHQDTSYLPIDGDQAAVMWISFDPVTQADSLEFIRGSHRGTLYDGSIFDAEDDTKPLYGDGSMPRLPDIEADRSKWDILSWAVEPGDVVVFHPSVLHGGAPTHVGKRRRTLSLRFFGPDAIYAYRPGVANIAPGDEATVFDRLVGVLNPGDALRHPDFPKVLPRAA